MAKKKNTENTEVTPIGIGLTDNEKNLVRDVYQILSSSPQFKKRSQQRQLIGFASNIFANGEIGIGEAPTGVGKTVSYLVSGIAASIVRGKRLIISTATVALQDQIMKKDINVVSDAFNQLGYKVNTTLVKGRERYTCIVKLFQQNSQDDMFSENQTTEIIRSLQHDLDNELWDGEAESAKKAIPIELWKEIRSDRHSCNGEKCIEYVKCGFYKKVQEARGAHVVIVNHSLLMSSIMHVPNSMYGEFENNMYVFDEGHHIPEKSNSIFSSVIPSEVNWVLSNLKSFLTMSKAGGQIRTNATLQATILSERLKTVSKFMKNYGNNKTLVRFSHGVLPDEVLVAFGEAHVSLKNIIDNHFVFIDKSGILSTKEKMDFAAFKGRVEDLFKGIQNYVSHDEDNPIAKWAESNNGNWQFKCSPFDAGGLLYSHIWKNALEKKSGVLITSATIASTNGFDRFLIEIGLNKEQAKTLLLDTPYYDAYSKSKMLVPRMQYMPENVLGHTKEVVQHIHSNFNSTDGGILVLFASNKQMQDTYEAMPKNIQEAILMQGKYGFNEIIDTHRNRIIANQKSMIFGLATFAEGVDLPGNLCTKVIITKIPFPSPDEPLIAAACEAINKKTDNLAFNIVMMPKAGVRFKQSVGRLIRSDMDYGSILVLDRRLLEKSYGKKLMNNVPLKAVYA